jgi:hypothetical protein
MVGSRFWSDGDETRSKTLKVLTASASQEQQRLQYKAAAMTYLRLAMYVSLNSHQILAKFSSTRLVALIVRTCPDFLIRIGSWPYFRYFKTATETTEYLWNLFQAGEFAKVDCAKKALKASKKNQEIVLQQAFNSHHWISVATLCGERLDQGDDSTLTLVMLTWAQATLGHELSHINQLLERIADLKTIPKDTAWCLPDLACEVDLVWRALQSSSAFRDYLATYYLPYNGNPIAYVDLDQKVADKTHTTPPRFTHQDIHPGDTFDAVFTWIDPTDPVFQSARASARQGYDLNDEFGGKNRFFSIGEIYLAIELLNRNVAKLNRIFIVTPNDKSRFDSTRLSIEARARLVFIKHEDLLGDTIKLPCFNSDAIESQLHRIPDISEYFVYLNDDFFITKKTVIHQYLQSRVFFTDMRLWSINALHNRVGSGARDDLSARIFFGQYGYVPSFTPSHHPYLCSKTAFEATNHIFGPSLQNHLYHHQFRQTETLRYLYLMFWLSAEMGVQQPVRIPFCMRKFFVGLSDEQLQISLSGENSFICLNNLNQDNKANFIKLSTAVGFKGTTESRRAA